MIHYTGDQDGQRIGDLLFQDYAEAARGDVGNPNPDHQPNPGMGVWFWRCVFDAGVLGVEGAIRKQRALWRQALGLPPATMSLLSLPRLRVAGARFETVEGKPWQWRGSSDFCLYARYLQNDLLGSLLQQRVLAGANLVRVLGMLDNPGTMRFHPQEHADYYARLPAFAAYLASAGLYLEFSVFADAQKVMPDVSQQRAHFQVVCAALTASPNALVEVGNEYGDWRSGDYGKNGFNPADFSKPPAPLLSCRGSAVGDVPPIPSPWDYSTFHETRSFPGWVKDGNTIEIQNGYGDYPGLGFGHPIVHDEPQKMGTGYERDRSLIAQFAGIVGASCLGATFHSQAGVMAQLWDDDTRGCAEVFYRSLSGCAE